MFVPLGQHILDSILTAGRTAVGLLGHVSIGFVILFKLMDRQIIREEKILGVSQILYWFTAQVFNYTTLEHYSPLYSQGHCSVRRCQLDLFFLDCPVFLSIHFVLIPDQKPNNSAQLESTFPVWRIACPRHVTTTIHHTGEVFSSWAEILGFCQIYSALCQRHKVLILINQSSLFTCLEMDFNHIQAVDLPWFFRLTFGHLVVSLTSSLCTCLLSFDGWHTLIGIFFK